MINICLEGPRGTGKSTVAQLLRSRTTNSTLINHTGFDADDYRIPAQYYKSWHQFFSKMSQYPTSAVFIQDRYFFSEQVYSELYKSYNFNSAFYELLDLLNVIGTPFHYIYLYAEDRKTFGDRLSSRDKIQLFKEVEESVEESVKQQELYDTLYHKLVGIQEEMIPVLFVHKIAVDYKSPEEIADEILDITGVNE